MYRWFKNHNTCRKKPHKCDIILSVFLFIEYFCIFVQYFFSLSFRCVDTETLSMRSKTFPINLQSMTLMNQIHLFCFGRRNDSFLLLYNLCMFPKVDFARTIASWYIVQRKNARAVRISRTVFHRNRFKLFLCALLVGMCILTPSKTGLNVPTSRSVSTLALVLDFVHVD